MNYSGLVQAKTVCDFRGTRHSPGDVFEVSDLAIWDDDPYVPVHVIGTEDVPVSGPPPQQLKTITKYAASRGVPVRPAIERMPPEHRLHAGVRKDA